MKWRGGKEGDRSEVERRKGGDRREGGKERRG